NRSDLIEEMAAKFGQLPRRDVELAMDTILSAMAGALTQGRHIEIRGFASFTVIQQAARRGRNPRTGESVSVPPRRTIKFKPGKELRANVDKPPTD
ncbi:MAG: integration host factor subunit beta, partial [Rhodoferax sp.]|nr:integration host factor subunit beta [Rhodoferax sp.]